MPPITAVRISADETAVAMGVSVAHDPRTVKELRGVYYETAEKVAGRGEAVEGLGKVSVTTVRALARANRVYEEHVAPTGERVTA